MWKNHIQPRQLLPHAGCTLLWDAVPFFSNKSSVVVALVTLEQTARSDPVGVPQG